MSTDTKQRDVRFPLDRPGTKELVALRVLAGATDAAVAEEFGVAPASVTRWRQRWQTQLDEARENQERALETYAITRKAQRIAKLDTLATDLSVALATHGVVYEEETRHSRKIHANPAVAELRATLQQAAIEMDQLPRAGVTVNNQNVVIVKQVSGPEGGNPAL